jgi:hypothetical protein
MPVDPMRELSRVTWNRAMSRAILTSLRREQTEGLKAAIRRGDGESAELSKNAFIYGITPMEDPLIVG